MSTSSGSGKDKQPASAVEDVPGRLVAYLRLGNPRVHLVFVVALAVLVAVCVAATVTRLSGWPLVPLAPLALAGFASWRARVARGDRQLLTWMSLAVLALAVAFWVLSVVGRALSS